MLVVFSPILVADTKTIFRYDFVAPLILITSSRTSFHTISNQNFAVFVIPVTVSYEFVARNNCFVVRRIEGCDSN